MAWEWSHTSEAYRNAYDNLHKQPREWLDVCLAEWWASSRDDYSYQFDDTSYDKQLIRAGTLPEHIAADFIWEKAETLRTCDNGGFNAWCCPYGCHTVPFSCEGDCE